MPGISALHLGAIVYVKDVEPIAGTVGETKTRRVVLLRKCVGPDDVLPCAVIKTLRGSAIGSNEVAIPWKPNGHSQTSLTAPSAVVCSWVIHVTLERIENLVGKCPVPTTAEIMRRVQDLMGRRESPE